MSSDKSLGLAQCALHFSDFILRVQQRAGLLLSQHKNLLGKVIRLHFEDFVEGILVWACSLVRLV